MNLVDRVKNIVLTPKTEWLAIAPETTPIRDLYLWYVVPLAAIAPVARFLGTSLFGFSSPFSRHFQLPIAWALTQAIVHYVFALVGVFIVGLIIDALAPTFGGEKNRLQALKVAVYAWTPAWVAGILLIIPSLGALVLLASLYSIYVLYLGLPVQMKAPQEKAAGYTAVVIVCAIVVFAIIGVIVGTIGGFGMPS